ncbi:MAG: glycosyltransferase family 2 protein [Bacteroidetes bacterium]|nr:glycosyltransferase family 2 protein [Bacteroidota bacterium]
MSELKNISIIIPVFNESASLPALFSRLDKLMLPNGMNLKVVLVDDGSTDDSAHLIERYVTGKPACSAIFLSRNFGHAIALSAGISNIDSDADAAFIIDADLQDPPELLPQFVAKMEEGFDVVYGIRKNRKEGLLKKICYRFYYRLQKKFSNIHMPLDAGDFSLISKRVVKELNNLPEESRYLRGLRSWVGFKQAGIDYNRDERKSGSSKYSLRSLFKLAFNGIFNFSEFPIRFIGMVGFATILLSLVYIGVVIYKKLVFGTVPEGFTTLIFAIVLFSGVQLLSLGIIGEYILRIFFQVKQRPLFIVKSKITNGKINNE